METWKDVLLDMTQDRALERATSMVGRGTVYKLGRGGLRPEAELWGQGHTSDCSGFIAWCLGIPRELPPGSGHWLQTTTYWEGGGFPDTVPFQQHPMGEAMPADLLVYPDAAGKQGHIGMVTAVGAQGPESVVHCSAGNFRTTGDAIRETSPAVFNANSRTRLLRVHFDALRIAAGIGQPSEDDLPRPVAPLRSVTLSHDPSLRLVASGLLELEPTHRPMGGVAALQAALRCVDGMVGAYAQLAVAPVEEGVFGDETARALMAFQRQISLEPTGTLDATTLRALDTAMMAGLAAVDVQPPGASLGAESALAPLPVAIRQDDKKFFARVASDPEFFVGRRVSYLGRVGLTNSSSSGSATYAAKDYVVALGHWANLLEPTAMCEGEAFFDRLNTYDRARFTFGFLQFAAHVPDGDYVHLLHRLLTLPLARAYFPDLTLIDGRVAAVSNAQTTVLETSSSTKLLLDYLNPGSQDIEEREVVNCAKLVHWCAHDPAHRAAQVEIGVLEVRRATKVNHGRYDLDGRTDVTCLIIFDIHHQGRATVSAVRNALAKATTEESAWEELLAIGLPTYEGRVTKLRKEIAARISSGILGKRRYVASAHDFV